MKSAIVVKVAAHGSRSGTGRVHRSQAHAAADRYVEVSGQQIAVRRLVCPQRCGSSPMVRPTRQCRPLKVRRALRTRRLRRPKRVSQGLDATNEKIDRMFKRSVSK